MTAGPQRVLFRRPLELFILSALALAAVVLAGCAATQEPTQADVPQGPAVEVTTAEGVVRGVSERDVHTFKGIPYAAPVGGVDRWRPPQPPAKREGVFDARHYGPACEQTVAMIPKWMLTEAGEVALYEMSDLEGFAAEEHSGDCLRLNLWTPELPDPNATVPVVVPAPVEVAPVAVPADAAPAEAAPAEPAPAEAAPADAIPADAAPAEAAPADAVPAEAVPAEVALVEAAPKGLPVVVNLHGGGLTSGSGAHHVLAGTHWAKRGVVYISINYRLGAIGFLAGDGLFDGDLMKGNRGFMDTVRALEWVRDNIASFGGDPNNVTLMGQSGGGTNVWSVLASPRSEGLIHRAIVMSGPIYDYPVEEHKKLTTTVLEGWGAQVGDAESLGKILDEDAYSTASTTTLVGSGDTYGSMSRTYLPAAGATGTDFLPTTFSPRLKRVGSTTSTFWWVVATTTPRSPSSWSPSPTTSPLTFGTATSAVSWPTPTRASIR